MTVLVSLITTDGNPFHWFRWLRQRKSDLKWQQLPIELLLQYQTKALDNLYVDKFVRRSS